MNANERPTGFLMPELAPPPIGVRPFISRRPTPPALNPNHVPARPVAGEPIPLAADWCYRCATAGHAGEYECWIPVQPIAPAAAVKLAALAARAAAGVPLAIASWSEHDEGVILDVAAALIVAVDQAREARRILATRRIFTVAEVGER